MKKFFILFVIMVGLFIACSSPTEPETYNVEYYFDNASVGYSYYNPITNEIVSKSYPINKTFTKTFSNVSGGKELELYAVCENSAYGVTVRIIVDGKQVAEGKGHQNAGAKYFLK